MHLKADGFIVPWRRELRIGMVKEIVHPGSNKEIDTNIVGFISVFKALLLLTLSFSILAGGCNLSGAPGNETGKKSDVIDSIPVMDTIAAINVIDSQHYTKLISRISHGLADSVWTGLTVWPKYGAILPFYRIVAYYGNYFSTRMGILGALPPDEMVKKLESEAARWEQADTTMPVKPALHYIAVTAQRDPGKDAKYRLRMPFKEIDKTIDLARKNGALIFLDIQVGHSTLEEEIPRLEKYLMMPDVHLGIDPEYAMKDGSVPGKRVGTFDARDINYASGYLADLVRNHDLPPKVLVVHRFKQGMVTNYKNIQVLPEVQVVMNMDGFGNKGKKLTTYKHTITREPVQFAGFKLFYKNDAADPAQPRLMTPEEILSLYPVPVYIQYQ